MLGRKGIVLWHVVAVILCQAAAPRSSAQGLHNILRAQDRVFPAVGPGVEALKRDSTGRYYILAEPATSILVYNAAGKLLGQIPNANSRGAAIRYAVSIDLDPQDRLFVADRGANAVKIFMRDGSLVATIPVTAPTSVVALSEGQFAVTQLQSKRLVKIMDERGATIRTFGDPADQPGGESISQTPGQPAAQPVMDRGRITGDSKGNIYFAFTSLPDPTLQRFDRFGYSAFESVMPAADFGALGGRDGRDVEIGYTMSGVTGPGSVTAWTDLHSVRASVGRSMGRRGRGGEAVGGGASSAGTSGGATGGAGANSSDSSDANSLPDIAGDTSDLNGDTLSYNSQNASGNSDTLLFANSGTDSSMSSGLMMPGMLGMGFGGAFHFGGFHGGGPADFGGFGGGEGAHPDFGGGRPPEGGEGFEHFGHFHPGFNTYRATATLKVALDDPSKHKLDKPVLTAVGIDPHTQDAWAAIGDTLVRLDSYGNRLDIFYLTLPSGASIRPTSILVEPNRILVASDPWGIFEFPRPDQPSSAPAATPTPQLKLVPEPVPPTATPPPSQK